MKINGKEKINFTDNYHHSAGPHIHSGFHSGIPSGIPNPMVMTVMTVIHYLNYKKCNYLI